MSNRQYSAGLAVCPVALLLIAVVATCVVAAEERPQVRRPFQITAVDWLAGEWKGPMWGGEFVAYYSTPEGGKIISHSKLVKEGAVVFHEFEVFESEGATLVLKPYPGGKPATSLTFHSHDPESRKLVFENPKKDYPTRIVYRRADDRTLVITLTDPHGGSSKVERFELTRVDGENQSKL